MNIVTYCSENYADIFLNLFLPTWIKKSGASQIVIYTDGWNLSNADVEYDLSKVEIIEFFAKSTDWLINTGRRYIALKDNFTKFPNTESVLLDIDLYILQDITHVFQDNFDVAVTRLNDPIKKTATAGVVFFKNRSLEFVKDCLALAEENKSNGIGVVPDRASYIQYSFDTICKSGKYKIKEIDTNLYNTERDDIEEWLNVIKDNKVNIKMIHFKERRGENKQLVKRILDIINE